MLTETELLQIAVLENHARGGVIAGPEHLITDICRRLGFKHRGPRVYLTAAKMALLGLESAESVCPGWRKLPTEQLRAVGWGK